MTTAAQTPKCETLGLKPSFGFGDRIGLATPGHVNAMKVAGEGIAPIFPQQSIREMTRTSREPAQVMDDALRGAAAAHWSGPIGADADHLKSRDDIDRTAPVGFTFFTIDPSSQVEAHADNYDEAALRQAYSKVADEIDWLDSYVGKSVRLDSGTLIEFTEEVCARCAVKYGRALNEAIKLGDYIKEVQQRGGRDYEIELSVDETEQPTTLAEHYIVADQCLRKGMKLVSLAPRYIGRLEKGVDYKGDVTSLKASLSDHASIAERLGPYKLSLHSGSDKLSMYGALARATKGRFHVKTAGTSYLEALRVVARHESELFRRIIDYSRSRYETDKASYHVSATLDSVPAPESVNEPERLEQLYLGSWKEVPRGEGFTDPGRQILHCTFGSVLTHPEFGKAVRSVLEAHPQTYEEVLGDHFARHLKALRDGLVS